MKNSKNASKTHSKLHCSRTVKQAQQAQKTQAHVRKQPGSPRAPESDLGTGGKQTQGREGPGAAAVKVMMC